MGKLSLKKAIKLYDEGDVTLRGVYNACETDLDFYNFLGNHVGMSDSAIMKTMREVTWADDAYYNALAMAEWEDDEE